jgi:hypothetical protein
MEKKSLQVCTKSMRQESGEPCVERLLYLAFSSSEKTVNEPSS